MGNSRSQGTSTHGARLYIGCAGWTGPPAHAAEFAHMGSHLARYSARFHAVEINSSFYRPHSPTTCARWAATVPEDFRFAVKVPKEITHIKRLCNVDVQVERFLDSVVSLGPTLGPLLVQLPPSMTFDAPPVDTFFRLLRERFSGDIVCEPRHRSWFSAEADHLLAARHVGRVPADPAIVPRASVPGGWQGLMYYRLHGSPRMYYSPYGTEYIEQLAQTLAGVEPDVPIWCIFDNTAAGAATQDALFLQQKLTMGPDCEPEPQTRDERGWKRRGVS